MARTDELLAALKEIVEEARGIPLAGEKCIVDRDQLLDLIEELQDILPEEIKSAEDIMQRRSELVEQSKRAAETIRRQAEEAARQMVSETEIVLAAKRRAKEILGNAEIQGRELRRGANQYCEDTLKRTEEAVALSLEEVRKARQRFKSLAKRS